MLQRTRAAAEVLLRDEVVAAPRTSLNQPIGTLRRIETVSADLRDLKTVKSRLGGTVNDVALHATLAGTLFATRLCNVTITNVPGPAVPLYALGSQMREIYGLVPIAADHGLGVAILSYDGRVTFTIDADRTSVPDAHVFRAGIEESLGELLSLAKGAIPVTC